MQLLLGRFLHEEISPQKMREQLQKQMQHKSFSLVEGSPAPQPAWNWLKTILDVRLVNPNVYCADIHAWAEAVHNDIQQADLTGLN